MTALPTNDALDAAVAELVARCATWTPIGPALDAIRRMQSHCTLESLTGTPKTTTHPAPGSQRGNVLFFPTPHEASGSECYDDEPPEAA